MTCTKEINLLENNVSFKFQVKKSRFLFLQINFHKGNAIIIY